MMRLPFSVGLIVLLSACIDQVSIDDVKHTSPLYGAGTSDKTRTQVSAELQMVDYTDPFTGYEAQIPKGWRRVVTPQSGEIGFTVIFESPQSDPDDVFADYMMVELLPGGLPSGFPYEPVELTTMEIDGRKVNRERIILENYPVEDAQLDLVAWQLKLVQSDYSMGVYLVGEQQLDARLERILIEFAYSFRLPVSPFKVSENSGNLRPRVIDFVG